MQTTPSPLSRLKVEAAQLSRKEQKELLLYITACIDTTSETPAELSFQKGFLAQAVKEEIGQVWALSKLPGPIRRRIEDKLQAVEDFALDNKLASHNTLRLWQLYIHCIRDQLETMEIPLSPKTFAESSMTIESMRKTYLPYPKEVLLQLLTRTSTQR